MMCKANINYALHDECPLVLVSDARNDGAMILVAQPEDPAGKPNRLCLQALRVASCILLQVLGRRDVVMAER
eukprot:2247080-Pleurochrysis_carterae.AAC.1